jgi:hypothetical protein
VPRLISARKATAQKKRAMKIEYDFSKAKHAKDVPHLAKLQAQAPAASRVMGNMKRLTKPKAGLAGKDEVRR